MLNFRNAARVRALVRIQLLAGAETTFAFVLAQHPSLDLEAIAKADADVNQYFPVVIHPASIIVDRLEVSFEANYGAEMPNELSDTLLNYVGDTIVVNYFVNDTSPYPEYSGTLGCKFIRVHDVTCLPNL
jgi:hypothetical protein